MKMPFICMEKFEDRKFGIGWVRCNYRGEGVSAKRLENGIQIDC